MDIRKLQRAIVDGLEDVKGHDIVVFNTEHLSPLFERVIIASGTSNRQTKALASSVRDAVRKRGLQVMRTEGADNGEWIIVDCGAAVAHIMQPAIREYYHLEEIWGGKPVKMKLGDEVRGLVKASEDDEDDELVPTKSAAKSPAKSVPGKSATAKTAAGRTATKSSSGGTPGKSAARKSAGAPHVRAASPASGKSAGRSSSRGAGASAGGERAPARTPAKSPGRTTGASSSAASPRSAAGPSSRAPAKSPSRVSNPSAYAGSAAPRKTSAKKSVVTRTTGVKSSPVRTPTKTSTASRAPAQRPAAKKSAPRR